MFAERIKTTCPRDCYDSCGMIADRSSGKLKLLGDPEHDVARGALCQKCAIAYNSVWLDPEKRLQFPLKRVGKKGEGKFERVSWETAIADIAARLKALADHGEARKIIQTHYTGTFSLIAFWFPWRFFNRLGATEVDPDTICNKAGHVGLNYILGDSLAGFDPRQLANAHSIVVWGANPSHSAPHLHEHWLGEFRGKKIAIDPIRHGTAKSADLHLQPLPGSDAALAFAMMHIAWREQLLDREFLAAHTIGWDELEPTVRDFPLAEAEQITGVPVAQIEAAVRIMAEGPAMFWLGQGMQRQACGGNAVRAIASLCAALGHFGKPGTGSCFINGPNTRGIDLNTLMAPHLGTQGAISHMELATCLEDATRSQALVCWNNNILASNPDQARLRASLEREDLFHVCLELFATDTTDYADYILPAASFMEFDDLVVPYFRSTVSAQVKIKEPEGEALPNQEIFRRLSRALDFAEPELYESDESMMAAALQQAGLSLSFAELAKIGTIEPLAEPYVQFDGFRFPTPSGKLEFASERAEQDGVPRLPFAHADAATAPGKLRVLSPAGPFRMNSEYDNAPAIRNRTGLDEVRIHPQEADARALQNNEAVELANGVGRLVLRVVIDPDVAPGIALVHKGRWPKFSANRANINALFAGKKSDMGESTTVHAVEATLRPVQPAV